MEEEIADEREEFLPYTVVLREEESQAILALVLALPARQREAVTLVYYQSLSMAGAAEVMGVSRTNVFQYLEIAREKIKQGLLQEDKKNGNIRLGSFAMLPIGPLLRQVFRMEDHRADSENDAWREKTLHSAVTVNTAAASSRSFGLIGYILAAAVGIPLLLFGLAWSGLLGNNTALFSAVTTSQVVFGGGDAQHAHLNPQSASVEHSGPVEDIGTLGWEITDGQSGALLYSGRGDTAQTPFGLLESGTYVITFTLENPVSGRTTAESNFQIIRRE
jgi:predicted DNA-binding protein (UPF0251 family)